MHCVVEFKPHNFIQRYDRLLWVTGRVFEANLVNIIQVFPKAVSKIKHSLNEKPSIVFVQKLVDMGNVSIK